MDEDLVQWLRVQLDTDARENESPYADTAWHARGCENLPQVLYPDHESGPCDCGVPARVASEIDAKRRLLDEYTESEKSLPAFADMVDVGRVEGLRVAVAHIALPYAGRPGWDESWRP
jgi:hypothetical protein